MLIIATYVYIHLVHFLSLVAVGAALSKWSIGPVEGAAWWRCSSVAASNLLQWDLGSSGGGSARKPKGMAWAYISQVSSDRQRRRIWCKLTPETQRPGTACTVHANQTTISAVNNNRHTERGRRRERKAQTHQHTTHAHTHTLTSKTCASFNTIAADAQKGGICSSDL